MKNAQQAVIDFSLGNSIRCTKNVSLATSLQVMSGAHKCEFFAFSHSDLIKLNTWQVLTWQVNTTDFNIYKKEKNVSMGVWAKVKQRCQYWPLSAHGAIIQATLTKLLWQEYFSYVTSKVLNQKKPSLVTHNWSQKDLKCIFFN